MHRFLVVLVLAVVVQSAASQESSWALGLDLDDSLSLWKIGPDTAWGLTLESASYIKGHSRDEILLAGGVYSEKVRRMAA